MTDFSEIIAQIVAVIKENGKREITGQVLQDILVAMLEAVAKNAGEGNLIPEGGVTTDKIGENAVTVEKLAQEVVDKFAEAFGTESPLSFKTVEGVKTLIIDLSGYYTKSEVQTLIDDVTTEGSEAIQRVLEAVSAEAEARHQEIQTEQHAREQAIEAEAQSRRDGDNTERQARETAVKNEADARELADQLETQAREAADAELKRQIEGIVASSDVVDIVGTYAELQAYDKSKLGDNDIIKVLKDSTHDDAASFFRFKYDTQAFDYVGSEAKGYTQAEADLKFQTKEAAAAEHAIFQQGIAANKSLIDTEREAREKDIEDVSTAIEGVGGDLTTETNRAKEAERVINEKIGAIGTMLDTINGEII